jgi:glucose dehydrogenase
MKPRHRTTFSDFLAGLAGLALLIVSMLLIRQRLASGVMPVWAVLAMPTAVLAGTVSIAFGWKAGLKYGFLCYVILWTVAFGLLVLFDEHPMP